MERLWRSTKGLGNATLFLRLRGTGGTYYNFVTRAFVVSQVADCKIFGTEIADESTTKSDYLFTFTPPAGNYHVQIVNSATNEVIAREDIDTSLLAFLEKITALVDIGAGVLAELGPITMEKGENRVITIQVLENGSPKDCTGYTAKLGVKGAVADTAYKFTPVDGVFSNDVNNVKSMLTFTIAPDTTKAMTPFGGVYSAAIYDALGKKYPLPPERGGLPFVLKEDVLDVV